MPENKEYKVIGTRPIRHDGVDKVTGRALYGADFQTAGLLHGRVLRSPHAHARIISQLTQVGQRHYPALKVLSPRKTSQTRATKFADLGEGAVNLKHLCDKYLGER